MCTPKEAQAVAYLSFASQFGGLTSSTSSGEFFYSLPYGLVPFSLYFQPPQSAASEGEICPHEYSVAFIATIIWAVHPLHVSTVSYIVQRMSAMAALFYIMSMYFYLKARMSQKIHLSVLLFALSILSALASFLSKENSALLPAAILLIELLLIRGARKDNL